MTKIEKIADQGKLDQEIENLGLKKISLPGKVIFIVKNDFSDTIAILTFSKTETKIMELKILYNTIKFPDAEKMEIPEAVKKASEFIFSENQEIEEITTVLTAEQQELKKALFSIARYGVIQNLVKLGTKRFAPNPSLLKIAKKIQPKLLSPKIKEVEMPQPETKEVMFPTIITPAEKPVSETPPPEPQKKEMAYPIIVEVKHPDPRNTNNDLTKKEENFFTEKISQIKNLIDEVFKIIKFNGLHNPLKINFDELLKTYDFGKEGKKIRLMAIVGKKLNRIYLGSKQIEKIILYENYMEIFFEQTSKPLEKTMPEEQGEQQKTLITAIADNNMAREASQTATPVSGQPEDNGRVVADWIEKVSEDEKLTPIQIRILTMASLGGLKTSDLRRIKVTQKDITELINKGLIIFENNKYELTYGA